MADQKSRGGQKDVPTGQGQNEKHRGTVVTDKPGDHPEAQEELRGRDHRTDPMPKDK